jgi:hypothetical protein
LRRRQPRTDQQDISLCPTGTGTTFFLQLTVDLIGLGFRPLLCLFQGSPFRTSLFPGCEDICHENRDASLRRGSFKKQSQARVFINNHRHIVVTGRTTEAIPYVLCSELVMHDV